MVADRIFQWARSQPHKPALIHNDVALRYADFARAIETARRFFASRELPVGETAIVCIDNLAETWIVVSSLRMSGMNTICVNSTTVADALELRSMKSIACSVILENERLRLGPITDGLPNVRNIVVPGQLFAKTGAGDIPDYPRNAPSFGGHFLYTSGTTGKYKKILRRGDLEAANNAYLVKVSSFCEGSVIHCSNFGLWTGAGFKHPPAVWDAGGTVVLDQRSDRAAHFFRHGVNAAITTPFELVALLAEHGEPRKSVEPVALTIGGGFVSTGKLEDVAVRLSNRIRLSYAASEVGIMLEASGADGADTHWFTPVDGRVVEIVDDRGRPCEPNQPGALRVGLLEIDADGYFDDDETSAKFFRDGYFYPGDMAVRRADSRIRILGRIGDVLNVRGTKIPVVPLEQEVQNLVHGANVCLFGGLDPEGAEELVIAIEAERVSRAEIDAVARRFSKSGVFDRIRFVVLKEFPRTRAGLQKIDRLQLRHMVWGKS